MSVSKITGRLTFAVLIALAMTGCVVASDPGSEPTESSEKTGQATATELNEKTGQATATESSKGDLRADETAGSNSSSGSTGEAEPAPLPWVQGDPPPATAEKIPLKPHVVPPRTEPFPE